MRSKPNIHIIITLMVILTSMYVSSFTVLEHTKALQATYNPLKAFNGLNETEVPQRPLLSIKKTVNATLVQPYQWIHITVLITNVGNSSAYNLTIVDPALNSWAAKSLNLTEERYVRIDFNASVYYDYYIQPVLEGNYTIEATTVTYYDINGTRYRSFSQRFNVLCLKPEEIPILEKDKWLTLTKYLIAILVSLFVIVISDYVYIKLKQRKAKPKKRTKVQKPISKRKEKKKQKKQKRKRK